MSYLHIFDGERHFVQNKKRRPQGNLCQVPERIITRPSTPPPPQTKSPKPPHEKVTLKHGKIRIEIKNAKLLDITEDKATGSITLKLS